MGGKLKVGHRIEAEESNWQFSGDVAHYFDSHALNSIPFYEEGHLLINRLSDFFVLDDSTVYDLGCSTGVLIQQLAERHSKTKGATFIGLDSQKSMIDVAQGSNDAELVSFKVEDIINVELLMSDFIISYYTIQFIPPRVRQLVFDRIYNALNYGGGFVLFEKVRGADARFQDILTSLYTDFKLEKRFSESEIIAKSKSLKGVLEPFSTQGNLDMLTRAGFVDVMTIMKYGPFEGFLAIK